jgi:hypothetical protein
MACAIYTELGCQIAHARDEVLRWRRENGSISGQVLESGRRKLEKAAAERLADFSNERFRHAQTCSECRRDRSF